MKVNVIAAALVGLILGVVVEFFFTAASRGTVLECLFAPVAFIFGLGLPILIGVLAAAWGRSRGLMTTPTGIADGAIAAALAELVSRLVGLCASLIAARSFFLGPRFLLPSVGPATHALFSGVWELGWFLVSLAVAAILGALGALIYSAMVRR